MAKKFPYLSVLVAALAVSTVGSLRLGISVAANSNSDATSAYNRTEWKAKYVRPPSTPFPDDNRFTQERELLGRTLFFDPRISSSGTISCATCHNPGFSWGDGLTKGIGNGMRELHRRTPTILNTAWSDLLFWDGRAESLEEQALVPVSSPTEMNQPLDAMVTVVTSKFGYKTLFECAYPGEGVTPKTVARAIATFERTVVSGRAPFDEWVSGQESAIPEAAKRGFDLFNTKAACRKCHEGWNFTDNGFHDVGLADDDRGRGSQLPLEAMQHAFKTPTLRNSDRRGPYMHDGSERSLEDVIELYDRGGKAKRPSLALEVVPLCLTAQEKADLLSFLRTLTSNDRGIEVPTFPR